MTTKIFVTVKVPGIHWWPEGNTAVHNYLQYPHRHIFHIKVTLLVTHGNRQVEFFEYQDLLMAVLYKEWGDYKEGQASINFGANSCEIIALRLLNLLNAEEVEVSEDGECGAIVSNPVVTF